MKYIYCGGGKTRRLCSLQPLEVTSEKMETFLATDSHFAHVLNKTSTRSVIKLCMNLDHTVYWIRNDTTCNHPLT
jgi:hypothetical protein